MEQNGMQAMFDGIDQPVFQVQSGHISYLNPAALRCGLVLGQAQGSFLPGEEVFPECSDGQRLSLKLVLPSGSVDATVQLYEGGYLFILSRPPRPFPEKALTSTADALRTPLTDLFSASASLYSQLEELEDPSILDSLSALCRSQYRILNIIENLEDYSLVCSGSLRLSGKRTDLTEYLLELMDTIAPLCAASGRKLSWRTPPKPVTAWIDPIYCKRMLLCLIGNAMKFSPADSEITVSYARVSDYAVFTVSDQGEGMTAEILSGAFCRFEDRGIIPDPRWGVGFGLPLARAIAELHGGALILQTAPDRGTTAAVRIPLTPDPNAVFLEAPAITPAGADSHPMELMALSDVLPMELYDIRGL